MTKVIKERPSEELSDSKEEGVGYGKRRQGLLTYGEILDQKESLLKKHPGSLVDARNHMECSLIRKDLRTYNFPQNFTELEKDQMLLIGRQKFNSGAFDPYLGPNAPSSKKRYSSRYSFASTLSSNTDLGIGTKLFFQSLWWTIILFVSTGVVQAFVAMCQWFHHIRYYWQVVTLIIWTIILCLYAYFHRRLVYKFYMKFRREQSDADFALLLKNR